MHLIVSERNGQMGNQLVLIAHLIALCEEFGLRASFLQFHAHRHAFEGPSRGRLATFPPSALSSNVRNGQHLEAGASMFWWANKLGRALRRVNAHVDLSRVGIEILTTEGETYSFDKDLSSPHLIKRIQESAVTFLFGWRYRNYKLLKKHKRAILDYLSPSKEIDEQITVFFSKYSDPISRKRLGVHVRHGDYASFDGGRHYLSLDHYAALAKSFAATANAPVDVIIFSNEPQDLSRFSPLNVRAAPGSMYLDFHALSRCDYIIAPQSTFSAMASFLGDAPIAIVDQNSQSLCEEDFEVASHFGPIQALGSTA